MAASSGVYANAAVELPARIALRIKPPIPHVVVMIVRIAGVAQGERLERGADGVRGIADHS